MLVFLPIGDEVARLPQEWFLNTPVLWLGALVLIALVRGPLRNASALLKKPVKFAAAIDSGARGFLRTAGRSDGRPCDQCRSGWQRDPQSLGPPGRRDGSQQ